MRDCLKLTAPKQAFPIDLDGAALLEHR